MNPTTPTMKKKIIIIGHVNHGSTCLASAVSKILAKNTEVVSVGSIDEFTESERDVYLKIPEQKPFILTAKHLLPNPTYYRSEIPRNKFIDKPKNNYRK